MKILFKDSCQIFVLEGKATQVSAICASVSLSDFFSLMISHLLASVTIFAFEKFANFSKKFVFYRMLKLFLLLSFAFVFVTSQGKECGFYKLIFFRLMHFR